MDAVSSGEIDEMVALLTSGIDINLTLEAFYAPTLVVNVLSICS